jgi:CheY-like chemotaxis protein
VLGLAKLMGGRVRCTSELGKGSSFFVTLITRDGTADVHKQWTSESGGESPQGGKMQMYPTTEDPQTVMRPSSVSVTLNRPPSLTAGRSNSSATSVSHSRPLLLLVHSNPLFHRALSEQATRWKVSLLCTTRPEQALEWILQWKNGDPDTSESSMPQFDQDEFPLSPTITAPSIILCDTFFPSSSGLSATLPSVIPNGCVFAREMHRVWNGVARPPIILLRPSGALEHEASEGSSSGGGGGSSQLPPSSSNASLLNFSAASNTGLSAALRGKQAHELAYLTDSSVASLFNRALRKPVIFSTLHKVLSNALTGIGGGSTTATTESTSEKLNVTASSSTSSSSSSSFAFSSGESSRRFTPIIEPAALLAASSTTVPATATPAAKNDGQAQTEAQLFALPVVPSLMPLRVMIADDDAVNRKLLRRFLLKLGYSSNTCSASMIIHSCHAARRSVASAVISTEADGVKNAGVSKQRGVPAASLCGPSTALAPEGVAAAVDGAEALEMLKQTHWDLVLCDMQMPNKSGIEVTSEFFAWYRNELPALVASGAQAPRPVPPQIFALTANILDEHREACFKAGMQGYIQKPCSLRLLAQTIAQTGESIYQQYRAHHLRHPLPARLIITPPPAPPSASHEHADASPSPPSESHHATAKHALPLSPGKTPILAAGGPQMMDGAAANQARYSADSMPNSSLGVHARGSKSTNSKSSGTLHEDSVTVHIHPDPEGSPRPDDARLPDH